MFGKLIFEPMQIFCLLCRQQPRVLLRESQPLEFFENLKGCSTWAFNFIRSLCCTLREMVMLQEYMKGEVVVLFPNIDSKHGDCRKSRELITKFSNLSKLVSGTYCLGTITQVPVSTKSSFRYTIFSLQICSTGIWENDQTLPKCVLQLFSLPFSVSIKYQTCSSISAF